MKTGTQPPSLFSHLRDIFLLPVTVTMAIPCFIYDNGSNRLPNLWYLTIIGWFLLILGAVLFMYTVYLFWLKGNGTLAPWSPTQNLIVTGPYKYCRNPMISAVFFILSGETFILRSTSMLVWTCLFFLINTVYFVYIEEPSLEKRFGEPYRNYKKNVPRWLPKIP